MEYLLEQQKLSVPFPMNPCLDQYKRHRYMLTCLQFGFPKLVPKSIDQSKTLSIVGYGPSLQDTWKDIKRPIITMSGAHDFLIQRGIVPDIHCDMDPRPHKVDMLTPHKEVIYLMASVCNPRMWVKLQGYKVITWHAVSGNLTYGFVKKKDPGALMISGGSCMGLVAIHLAGVLGYNHFELHGYDGSFRDGSRHAGPHGGHSHGKQEKELYGRKFEVSKIMENSNVEFEYLLQHFPVFCVLHGDGRNQWWAKNANLPNVTTADSSRVEEVRNGKVLGISEQEARERGFLAA